MLKWLADSAAFFPLFLEVVIKLIRHQATSAYKDNARRNKINQSLVQSMLK